MNEAEQQFQERLAELILNDNEDGGEGQYVRVASFAEAGVMTMNAGLEVQLEDGSTFQLTIVQSERAR
jgi:hypothetical protein